MVNVTNGSYVAVRLIALKLLFCHFKFSPKNKIKLIKYFFNT